MPEFRVDDLKAFGFSERVIERWRQTGVSELLPLQIQALQKYAFVQGRVGSGNLLVLAPTSSGKTFVAELAALKHMEAGRRVIYLVPTKALAEEKGRLFHERYGPLNYRIAVATRERPESDRLIASGKFDLLVAVYEKMKAYLITRPQLLSQLGLVVVDEIQTLGERGRGESLDLLLGKIAASPNRPQFIGLSAVLSEGARLADWLKCDLLLFRNRPVELREGVLDLSSGAFRFRCANSGEEAIETLIPQERVQSGDGFDAESGMLSAVQWIADELAEQVIVFVPTRHQSRTLACQLAAQSSLPVAEDAIEELSHYEETASRNQLLECLQAGVAFHNADLSPDLRALIEAHYADGSIRVLVSTSTLGQGVNLTGRNVIQVAQMAAQDPWTGETTFVPLSVSRFRNQGGRAGRYSLEQDFGRSMILANGVDEAERLYRQYAAGELELLAAPLRGQPLDGPVMDYLASGIARNPQQIKRLLGSTYTGFSEWDAGGETDRLIDETVERLAGQHLIRRRADGALEVTGLGRAMAIHGLSTGSILRIGRWLDCLGSRQPTEFETLLLLCSTQDADAFPCYLTMQERQEGDYLTAARDRLNEEARNCPVFGEMLFDEGGLDAARMCAVKKAFVLYDWIGVDETSEIEQRYAMLSGTMANLAAHIHWLLLALIDAADAFGLSSTVRQWFRRLAQRLPLGLDETARGLALLRVRGLSRGMIQSLVREGYDSVESLKNVDEESLTRLIPKRVAEEIVLKISTRKKPVAPNRTTRAIARKEISVHKPKVRLLIDESNPGRIMFDGQEVQLTPLPYRLLTLLARRASSTVSYPVLAAQLWPDGAVEMQQIPQHARRIAQRLAPIVGEKAAKSLIETRRGIGLRLVLNESEVSLLAD